MADANFIVDLDALNAAIVADIVAAFPSFQVVEFDREDEDQSFATPACVLEMTEAEPQKNLDAGSGQWPAMLRFDARIIFARRGAGVPQEIRKAATAFATWLNLRHFTGQQTDEVNVIACEKDEFAPHLDKFVVWRVEFVLVAFLGAPTWTNDGGVVPTDVLYSWAPNIGIPHEPEYVHADGTPRA
jgi:hypothetical protein